MSSLHACYWKQGFEQLQRRFAYLDTEFTPATIAGKSVRRRLCLSCRALSDEYWAQALSAAMSSCGALQTQTEVPPPTC